MISVCVEGNSSRLLIVYIALVSSVHVPKFTVVFPELRATERRVRHSFGIVRWSILVLYAELGIATKKTQTVKSVLLWLAINAKDNVSRVLTCMSSFKFKKRNW